MINQHFPTRPFPFGYPDTLARISENFLTHLILASLVSSKNLQLNPIHSAVTSSLSLLLFLKQCLIDIFSSVPCLINMSLAAGSVLINSKLLLSHQCLKKKNKKKNLASRVPDPSLICFYAKAFSKNGLSFSPLCMLKIRFVKLVLLLIMAYFPHELA